MIKNYITIALRNIWVNKTFSFINIAGLSVSMSLGLLIILIVKEQYSFDRFHNDADRIYRVDTKALRVGGGSEDYASVPLPLANVLKDNYSFTEEVVRLNRRLNQDIVYGTTKVPISGLFADPSFFKVFNFRLEKGDPVTALSSPEGLVVTHESAKKIFGNEDPMGKTVELRGYGNFKITGVLEKFEGKTHFEFEVLASMNRLPVLEKQEIVSPSLESWTNYYAGYIYIKLQKEKRESDVNAAFAEISRKYYKDVQLETRDRGYEFFLQPLNKISPGPILSNNMGRAMPKLILTFLSILAIVIMVMAGLNYTNLMIAKSLKRAREIGVRKVMGAVRWQVFIQFIGESVVFSILALIVSYLILQFLKFSFLQFRLTQSFSVDLTESGIIYILFLLFAIGIGIIAGLLPAIYLSGFRPVQVLKNAIGAKLSTRITFRKVLMVIQFTLSLVFIICVLFIYQQVRFMLSKNYGINEKNIINLQLQGNDYAKLANEIIKINGVRRVGAVSHSLGTSADRASDYRRNISDEPFVMRDFCIDENYLQNLEVKFVAGRNFQPGLSGERESEVILNETALKSFGFKDANSALNQVIYSEDSAQLQVIGVVKDFNFRTMEYAIGPLAFRYRPQDFSMLSIAYDSSAYKNVAAALGSVWKTLDPVHPVQFTTMEDDIDNTYIESGYTDIVKIIGYVSFLAITLACLGMLGMVMYSTQLKIREVGVRKVLGASVKDVTILLSRSFVILIVISVVIGIPIGYMLGNLFLQNFVYKISNTWLLVLLAILMIGLLGLITICSQTLKAALSNPVKSLRTE
jgi:putative ABC transport system permease protein